VKSNFLRLGISLSELERWPKRLGSWKDDSKDSKDWDLGEMTQKIQKIGIKYGIREI